MVELGKFAQAVKLRERAEECRRLAHEIEQPALKSQSLALADAYGRLACTQEELAFRGRAPPSDE